ncbi:MAG TPA: MerR family transcriptional regulator [Baekduia sp.]|uniref:MerR family transcriptional regulator n=1 Tax=Baekduia sp. TaxID=2600305 RepID=UPI002BB7335A|nr:MerR family transcriptional regulator [Baekduia sp.]HMJ32939.1 MerR family transcriptional regulator [Baekduia sp.]
MSPGPTTAPAPVPVPAGLRIGEVARLVDTTPRTIRYYEEIGLLPAGGDREAGRHRLYAPEDVDRLRDALRLRTLLGVSLDELKELLEAEEARGALRDEWRHGNPDSGRRREILDQALGHVEHQLELLAGRRAEIARLERELGEKRDQIRARITEQP